MQSAYLKEVQLSGYKTIKNTSIDFAPGLNIIIGRNGVGKTNFIELFNGYLSFETKINASNSYIFYKIISNKEEINIKIEKKLSNEFLSNKNAIIEDTSYFVNNKEFKTNVDFNMQVYHENNVSMFNYLFKHGIIHDELFFLNYSPEININLGQSYTFFIENPFLIKDNMTYFENTIYNFFGSPDKRLKYYNKITEVINLYLQDLVKMLTKYTPIKNVRLSNPSYLNDSNDKILIRNLYFEFFVNNSWLSFNQLSDGTKRTLLIVSKLSEAFKERHSQKNILNLFFIEEPELGLHPHQLFNLMQFIKQASEHCQIIITTHSPDVLDVLGKDDLHRLIIAEYEPEKGTTLRHLNEAEKAKATTYITEEAFLSSYWKYSDLEKN